MLLWYAAGHYAGLSTRRLWQTTGFAGDIDRLACFDTYPIRGNHDPSRAFDRQKPRSLIMADAKLAAGQEINPGPVGDDIQQVLGESVLVADMLRSPLPLRH